MNLVGIYIDAVKSYGDAVGTFANGAGWPEALAEYADDIIIVKDYLGAAYMPELDKVALECDQTITPLV